MKPMSSGPDRSTLLIPKQKWLNPDHDQPFPLDHPLLWLSDELGPAERRAMREIVEYGDLFTVDGRRFIVAPVSDDALEALAAFEAEGSDREPDATCEPEFDREPEGYGY